ncbi:30S ribosomal protein S3 [Candidatus Woesearchaeota archaeon]|nr:30S ribosomal protein S3 [Candidatus Woesearchaeota archaeon]
MIERDFIAQKTKEYYITEYVKKRLSKVGSISSIKLKKIPLGEKIIIYSSKPSLIVGSRGSNIRDLTKELKKEFNLENPQIEITEVRDLYLDAALVAEKVVNSLERFGSARFKSIGHKVMENVIKSGALGVELVISGKIPSARAKSWRFYQGYLKKCGDISIEGVKKAQASALLKTGIIGVKVAIMPPDLELPDKIELLSEPHTEVGEIKEAGAEVKKNEKKGKRVKAEKKEAVADDKKAAGEEKKPRKKKESVPKKTSPVVIEAPKTATEAPQTVIETPAPENVTVMPNPSSPSSEPTKEDHTE